MGHLNHLAADLLEGVGRLLGDLALTLGHHLRAPAQGLVSRLAGAAGCLHTGLGALTGHLGSGLNATADRLVGHVPTLLQCCRALAHSPGDLCPAPCGKPGVGTVVLQLAAMKIVVGHRLFSLFSLLARI